MNPIRRLTLAVALLAFPAPAALADPAEICIDARNILSTHAIDNGTILFTMNDGKVWKNTLKAACRQLQFRDAFTYDDFGGTICANQQRIRVLDQPTGAPPLHNLGPYCQLGDFTLQPSR